MVRRLQYKEMRERAARYCKYCTVEATVKFLSEKMEKPLGRSLTLISATVHWLVLLVIILRFIIGWTPLDKFGKGCQDSGQFR